MEPVQTVPFTRLLEFNNAGHTYLSQFPDERSTITFALNKLLKAYDKTITSTRKKWQDEIDEAAEDIRVKYCEKEEKTGVFKEKTYGEGVGMITKKVFTADNERKANKEIKESNRRIEEKYENELITLHKVHIIKPIPATMHIKYIAAFENFIFEPMTEEEFEAHYLAQAKPELATANGVHG